MEQASGAVNGGPHRMSVRALPERPTGDYGGCVDAWPILLFLAAIGAVLFATARANELFRISVHGGDVRLLRGRAPPGFVDDVRTLAKLNKGAPPGVVRAVKRSGRPLLVLEGFDEPTSQKLRNTFATHAVTSTRGRAGSRL